MPRLTYTTTPAVSRFEELRAFLPLITPSKPLEMDVLEGELILTNEGLVVFEQPDEQQLLFIDPWYVFILCALCDEVQGIEDIRPRISGTHIPETTVIQIVRHTDQPIEHVRLVDAPVQLWGAVQLIVMMEFQHPEMIEKIPRGILPMIVKIYNSALQGIKAEWIYDDSVAASVLGD